MWTCLGSLKVCQGRNARRCPLLALRISDYERRSVRESELSGEQELTCPALCTQCDTSIGVVSTGLLDIHLTCGHQFHDSLQIST